MTDEEKPKAHLPNFANKWTDHVIKSSSPGKKIAFYPDPDVAAWYESLPRYKGTEIINQILREHISATQQPHINMWMENITPRNHYLSPCQSSQILDSFSAPRKSLLSESLASVITPQAHYESDKKTEDRLEILEKRMDAVISLLQQLIIAPK